ncbi:MAG: hypothetical protein AB7U46_09465 [Paenirhodobacter sp.]|uniref:hypothetical protein n=1 Tax=Paenirhodobacter sp. TaxID=1965326 RepID=UPI003D0F5E90
MNALDPVLPEPALRAQIACPADPAAMREMTLLYLHSRSHADPRMPLLQHVLSERGHRGAVHSLRVETARELADALLFAQALARGVGTLQILFDGLPPELIRNGCPPAARGPMSAPPLRVALLDRSGTVTWLVDPAVPVLSDAAAQHPLIPE